MKFISVRELRSQSASVWNSLAEEQDLVITSNGKPIGLLSATSAETLDASLSALQQSRAQMAVAAMRERARATGADQMTLEDINAVISTARRQRRK